MTTTDFLTRYGADKNGMAHCPTHDDKKRSLHISPGRNGDTVLFDHGGCEVPDILAAKGLELSDLFSESKTSGAGRVVETTYDYRDEDGKLLFQAVRYNPKGFSQRRPDGGGDWIWKLDGVRRVPYRLPELIAADRNDPVFLPEGEKDVERLRDGGLVATCNSGGAGTGKNNFNWRAEYNESLRGARSSSSPTMTTRAANTRKRKRDRFTASRRQSKFCTSRNCLIREMSRTGSTRATQSKSCISWPRSRRSGGRRPERRPRPAALKRKSKPPASRCHISSSSSR